MNLLCELENFIISINKTTLVDLKFKTANVHNE